MRWRVCIAGVIAVVCALSGAGCGGDAPSAVDLKQFDEAQQAKDKKVLDALKEPGKAPPKRYSLK